MSNYKAKIVKISPDELDHGRDHQDAQVEELRYLLEAVTTEDEDMRAPGGNLHTCLEEIESLNKKISELQELEKSIEALKQDIEVNKRMIEQGIHRQAGPEAMLAADMRFNQMLAEAEQRHYELLQPNSSIDELIEIREEAIERKAIINRSIDNLHDTISRSSMLSSTDDEDCFKLLIPKPASNSTEDLTEYRAYIKELMTKLDRMQSEDPKAKGLYLALYSKLENQKTLIDNDETLSEDLAFFVFKDDIARLKSLFGDDGLKIEALSARAHTLQEDLAYDSHEEIPGVVSMSFDSFVGSQSDITEMTLEEFLSADSIPSSPEPDVDTPDSERRPSSR